MSRVLRQKSTALHDKYAAVTFFAEAAMKNKGCEEMKRSFLRSLFQQILLCGRF